MFDECHDINYIWLHISHDAKYHLAFIPYPQHFQPPREELALDPPPCSWPPYQYLLWPLA